MKTEKEQIKITEGLCSVVIYQVVNRGQWEAFLVAWFEDGDRKRKQFSDKKEAERFARETASRLADGSGTTVTVPRRILSRIQKLENLLQGKATLEDAIDEYITAHRITRPRPIDTSDVMIAFTKWLDEKSDYKNSYKETLRNYARDFAERFLMPIDEILDTDIEIYLDTIPDLSPKTQVNMLAGYKTIMEWAKNNGYLPKIAITAAEKAFHQNPEAFELLEPDQFKKLLSEASPVAVPFLLLSAYTGLPQQELQRLRWEDINWENGTLSTKGLSPERQGQEIQLSPALLKRLKTLKKTGPIIEIPIEQLGLKRLAAKAGLKWRTTMLTRSSRIYQAEDSEESKAWFAAIK